MQAFKTKIQVFFPNEITKTGAAATAGDRKAVARAARAARRNNRTSATSKVPSGPSFLENIEKVQRETSQSGTSRCNSATSGSSSRPVTASLEDFLSAHSSAPLEVTHHVFDEDDDVFDEEELPSMPADPDVGCLDPEATVEVEVEVEAEAVAAAAAAAAAATETEAEEGAYITVNPPMVPSTPEDLQQPAPEADAAPTPPTELPAMDAAEVGAAAWPAELEEQERESVRVRLAARFATTIHHSCCCSLTCCFIVFPPGGWGGVQPTRPGAIWCNRYMNMM